MNDKYKCRFCSFSVLKWKTRKDGKKVSGWQKLTDHLWEHHSEEAANIFSEERLEDET